MALPLLVPLDGGFHHGPPGGGMAAGHVGGADLFAPWIGAGMFFLFLLLLVGTLTFLVRRGHLTPPPWIGRRSPEAEARSILAERFARGDISSDEFMERASVLNWTPGSEAYPAPRGRKKRR